ncbi:Uncharacterised protein [Actinobacillus pleuropneumoniae]|nr:Uncharacterised protein [Actinobacillus pleuropneumoniae]
MALGFVQNKNKPSIGKLASHYPLRLLLAHDHRAGLMLLTLFSLPKEITFPYPYARDTALGFQNPVVRTSLTSQRSTAIQECPNDHAPCAQGTVHTMYKTLDRTTPVPSPGSRTPSPQVCLCTTCPQVCQYIVLHHAPTLTPLPPVQNPCSPTACRSRRCEGGDHRSRNGG